MNSRAALAEAYTQARYRIVCADITFTRRIGVVDAACDHALREAGCHAHWFIITPCNPHSRTCDDAENSARLHAMEARLRASGRRYVPTLASADDGTWPEPGFCIFDLDTHAAHELARAFAQQAIVGAALGDAPTLIWIDSADAWR